MELRGRAAVAGGGDFVARPNSSTAIAPGSTSSRSSVSSRRSNALQKRIAQLAALILILRMSTDPIAKFKEAQKQGWAHFAPLEALTTPTAARLVKFAGIRS